MYLKSPRIMLINHRNKYGFMINGGIKPVSFRFFTSEKNKSFKKKIN